MFDFVPLDKYAFFYYHIFLIIILLVVFHSFFLEMEDKKNIAFLNFVGCASLFFAILYIGFRPISGVFIDMTTYAYTFERFQGNNPIDFKEDYFFYYFIILCTKIMTKEFFFFTCALIYILPTYIVSKKWFKQYWFYSFLMLCVSFSFWSYGTNGIRNGIAGSLFLLGISRNKRVWQILWIFVAINFHKTMLLPTLGFVIAQFFNKPKYMIAFWVLCIPLSLAGGSAWEALFASLGFADDRISYLTAGNVNNDNFSSTGFRWDFLIYSATAVYAGWYFIVKKHFEDKIYFWLFNTYVFANAFWILVIRANFSNRFAYLSWFMMALVIVYPFLKVNLMKNQSKVFAKVLFLYFLFTFFMNVILKNND